MGINFQNRELHRAVVTFLLSPQQFIQGISDLQTVSVDPQNQEQWLVINDGAVPMNEGLGEQVDYCVETSHGYISSVMLFPGCIHYT